MSDEQNVQPLKLTEDVIGCVMGNDLSDDYQFVTDSVEYQDDVGKDMRCVIFRVSDKTYWRVDYWESHQFDGSCSLTDDDLSYHNKVSRVYPSHEMVVRYVDYNFLAKDMWEPIDTEYKKTEVLTYADGVTDYQSVMIQPGGKGIIISGTKQVLGTFLDGDYCVCKKVA